MPDQNALWKQACNYASRCESGISGTEDIECSGLFAGKPAPQTANLVFSVVLQQDARSDPKA
jgi:hypothetical protein